MLCGKSLLHVNQELGKCFDTNGIKGYYNDLTEKVTRQPELLGNDALPQHPTKEGEQVYFPVAIFQYGLAAYDLFLQTGDEQYKAKFRQCVEWTLANQEPSGAWNNFFFSYPEHPYGAMAQGEGASLLIRGYQESGDTRYLDAAQQAIDFMLTPLADGGTAVYEDTDIILLEYTHLPAVMNGWIFAWWGLYDYVKATHDDGIYKQRMEQSLLALEKRLNMFTEAYWSKYDLDIRIASPFYHHLHIAQMQAMFQLTGHQIFDDFARRWQADEKNWLHKKRAFITKVFQKIKE